MKYLKSISSFVMIGLIVITQLFTPVTVHADGDTTPVPTKNTEVVTTPELVDTAVVETSPPLPTDAAKVTATPEPAESPVASETPVPATETPAEAVETDKVVPEPTMAEILQVIPSETEVAVLDENGQQVPLATQEAEEIVAGSDPMWCPAGETPGGPGCTPSYSTVTDLIYDFYGLGIRSGPGTIYFTPIYSSNDVVFDHNNPSLAYLTDLTLQGGWNGATGLAFALSGNTVFNVPIGVYNWNGDIALNNVTVQNADSWYAVDLQQSIPATTVINDSIISDNRGSGLNISNFGNTIINRTTVSRNARIGADIGSGGIEINDSNFDNNRGDYGLQITSNDDVIIRGSSFNINLDHGADIAANNVVIMNSQFNQNRTDVSYGASINADGSVFLDGVTASENGSGVNIYASDVTIWNSLFNHNYSDYGHGAEVYSYGNVTLDNVTASNNFIGTIVYANGGVSVSNSKFHKDIWDGLEIFTGQDFIDYITLANNTFSYNNRNFSDGYGVWLVTDVFDEIDAFGNVFINNFAGLVASDSAYVSLDPSNIYTLNCIDIWTSSIFQPGVYCGPPIDPDVPIITTAVPDSSTPTVERINSGSYLLTLKCTTDDTELPIVALPNGDSVEIFCPVNGEAAIDRTDNTTLPQSLPDGYTYASAFDVRIFNKARPVWQIDNGGFIRSSFTDQPLQEGSSFSILYWDNMKYENGRLIENPDGGEWLPLKDYMQAEDGKPRVFRLHPDHPEDPRRIYSGVQIVDGQVIVDTNFPGIFVLAQY